ncbi:hypothetical protein [Azospirillum rugosum]|uniref:Glycosyl transferases group 1 n=1 Tax=Azospirillum rugosum TaxID=416170 RepID=A0ABS4SNX1_9PROT|nr:hypothetical protein [Azospirillum rugosum]MBP2294257.1 hypothetical protein [Azospirillum rugosum]
MIVTWPDVHNAEYEAILRIQRAAKTMGIQCSLVNNEGFLLSTLSSATPHRLRPQDIDFALSLHFESPKLFDAYTYTALWNPIEFYPDWGYEKSVNQLISHDDFVYSGSDRALRHVQRLRPHFPRLPNDAVEFYPSISDSIFAPTLGERKIFYCGMNWEKISNQKGRHHDLLRLLDESGNLALYGPKEFMGVKVWGDYESYVRPIAFDGWSLIREINKCGICLALMSDVHFHSGIASSRLYEGLSAGALVITDDHPFFRDRYGDNLLYISPLADGRKRFEQISDHLLWIERNPEAALAKAAEAQRIYLERFAMDKLLENLFAATETRRAAIGRSVHASKTDDAIEVIIPFVSGPVSALQKMLASLATQTYQAVTFTLLLDEGFFAHMGDEVRAVVPAGLRGEVLTFPFYESDGVSASVGPRLVRLGEAVDRALSRSRADYFCFMTAAESWFSDHLSRLKRVLDDDQTALGAYSGAIFEHTEPAGKGRRTLDFLRFDRLYRQQMARLQRHPGLFLFRRGLYDAETTLALRDLDGIEHLLFATAAEHRGALKPTTSATCIRHLENERHIPVPMLAISLQQSYLEDLGYLDRIVRPEVQPLADGELLLTPAAREMRGFPRGLAPYRQQSVIIFGKSGNHADYLGKGWSVTEDHWVWIDGVHAQVCMRQQLVDPPSNCFLRCDLEPLITGKLPSQTVTLSVNGTAVATVTLSRPGRAIITAAVPEGVVRAGEPLTIDIECANAYRPPGESRYLSVRLYALMLSTGEEHPVPELLYLNSEFNEDRYLALNPDVAAAKQAGEFKNGYEHFFRHGIGEKRGY